MTTNTHPLAPTDAEINAMAREVGLLPDNSHPTPETRAARKHSSAVQAFARDVLAKLGAQPVEREPLTDEQILLLRFATSSLFHLFKRWDNKEIPHYQLMDEMGQVVEHVIQRTVAANGIKGGQHGAE